VLQVAGKAYLKDDVRATCVELLTELSTLTQMVLSHIVKSKSDLPLSVVNSYTTVIKHCNVEKTMTEIKNEVLENFDFVLQWSIQVLSDVSNITNVYLYMY